MGPGKAESTGLHFVHASSASINPYKHTRRLWAHLTRPFFITNLVFSNFLIVISSLTLLLSIVSSIAMKRIAKKDSNSCASASGT